MMGNVSASVPLATLDLRLLGPLSVSVDEREIAGLQRKQRALLTALALRAGHFVAADELVEAVWGADPPASAKHALHVYVSRLRTAFGSACGRLEQSGGTYRLRLAPGETDIDQLRAAAEAGKEALAGGDYSAARDLLGAVVEAWRGEPFADAPEDPLAQVESRALWDTYFAAVEDRFEAELELGERDVVPELERLTGRHPERERLWAQLMVALYRANRQVEALRTYARARRTLLDDFGLEPSRMLRDLERAILLQDPRLSPSSTRTGYVSGLPAELTSFVGRESEIAALTELLEPDSSRLITLTGTAGVGKTRLAIRAARTFAERSGFDVAFVDLAVVPSAEGVLPAIAYALATDQADTDTLAALVREVNMAKLLLVLDNFEHVLEARTNVLALLRRAPALKIIATSRSPLALLGEWRFPVEPLPVPQPAQRGEELAQAPAVALFLDRATAVDPTLEVDPELLTRAAELCRALDGLPLAIELIAPRATDLRLEEFTKPSLDLLATDQLGPVERHTTMRRALEWSYNRLSPAQQQLFGRLHVFPGDFDADAAGAISYPSDGNKTARADLRALADTGLLSRRRTSTDLRYRLLAVIREYAHAVCDLPDDTLLRAHVEHYSARLDEAIASFRSLDSSLSDATANERENITLALRTIIALRDEELASRTALPLLRAVGFLCYNACSTELGGLSGEIGRLVANSNPLLSRVAFVFSSSIFCLQSDFVAAMAWTEEALSAIPPQEPPEYFAASLIQNAGLIAAYLGQRERAAAYFATLEGHLAELPDSVRWNSLRMDLLESRAQLALADGELVEAESAVTAAMDLLDSELRRLEADPAESDDSTDRAPMIRDKARVIITAARVRLALKDVPRSARTTLRALAATLDTAVGVQQALAFDIAGAILIAAGEPGDGAYLLGAADRLWKLLRTHGLPGEVAAQRDAVAQGCALLGREQFDLAYERGTLAAFDTTVEFAHDRLQELVDAAALDD
jgi:DNA-binding SARP family transcriptional activator/predicted ATPase